MIMIFAIMQNVVNMNKNSEIKSFILKIEDIELNVYVTYKNKRGISYKVIDDGIHVFSSKYYSLNTIETMLLKNSLYILKKYNKLLKYYDDTMYSKLLDKEYVLYMGEFIKTDKFVPYNELFKENKSIIEKIYFDIVGNLNISNVKLKIKELKSKWGSYNAKKHEITLNLYLLFFEKKQIEYVIYHEICHIGNLSHDRKFHHDLDILCPENKKFRKKINELTPLVEKLIELK